MNIELIWESRRGDFEEIRKGSFDLLAKAGEFVKGPLQTGPSHFAKEYGPYFPERWAFGELKNGNLVCIKIAP
ncbi:MAG: hypothetical protein V3W28_03690 [Thermoplasmata archaeon]